MNTKIATLFFNKAAVWKREGWGAGEINVLFPSLSFPDRESATWKRTSLGGNR